MRRLGIDAGNGRLSTSSERCSAQFVTGEHSETRSAMSQLTGAGFSATVFERYGLDLGSLQSEVRQGIIDTFQVEYPSETGKPLPLKPNDPRSEFLYLLADQVRRLAEQR